MTCDFNDPLDSLPHIYQNTEPKVYSGGGSDVYALINDWVYQRTEILSKTRNDFGIACFCECCDNFLMWSHYANNHKGFCLEYDTIRLYNLIIGKLFSVIYSNKHSYYTFGKKKFLESILIKNEIWEYEKEWRIIFSNKDIQKNTRTINLPNCVSTIYEE